MAEQEYLFQDDESHCVKSIAIGFHYQEGSPYQLIHLSVYSFYTSPAAATALVAALVS